MICVRDKSDYQIDWVEIHHSNIEDKDIEHWFKRFEFLIDNVIYTKDSDQFQQTLFWERLKG